MADTFRGNSLHREQTLLAVTAGETDHPEARDARSIPAGSRDRQAARDSSSRVAVFPEQSRDTGPHAGTPQTAPKRRRRALRPIVHFERNRDALEHFLAGFDGVSHVEARSEHGMAVNDSLPRSLEVRDIQFFVKFTNQLLNIHTGERGRIAKEQHALLQWCNRINISLCITRIVLRPEWRCHRVPD